ncbi:purple acid phosphatase family protein [Paenibacillus sp. GCM10027626]|uniref:purple acid phosphatase family protein n=1 Tax=Paenibacillus sp. GCM10027626 TaxID=3273411 RepID=UPI003638BCD1
MKRLSKPWLFALLFVLVAGALIWIGTGQKPSEQGAGDTVNPIEQQQPEEKEPDTEGAPVEQEGNKIAIPQAIVTTFKGDPRTSRAFTWHTDTTGEKAVLQLVKGTDASAFEDKREILEFQGESSELVLHNGKIKGVHKAEAAGLEAGASYLYRVGNGSAEGWSELAAFTTEQDGLDAFTFIDVADSQGITEQDFELWRNTLEQAFKRFPESAFLIHNGDLTEYPEDDAAWNHLLNKARPWTASVPFMPVTGNHDQVDKKADAFVSHFNLPDNGASSTIPGTSYTFNYGPVHFVMLNTEAKIKEQVDWLEEDLAANRQPWTIVSIHRPAYGGNQDKKVVKHWVPLFDKYGVDLVLQGHNHEYSRSYPLKDEKIVETGGTVYATVNASGQKFNKKKDDQYYHKIHFQNKKQMYAGIRIAGDKLTYQAYTVDGELADEFELTHK